MDLKEEDKEEKTSHSDTGSRSRSRSGSNFDGGFHIGAYRILGRRRPARLRVAVMGELFLLGPILAWLLAFYINKSKVFLFFFFFF